MNFFNVIAELLEASGFAALTWQNIAMILVSFVLFYLAIVKKFEPLLLLPISFGMFLVNLPLAGLMDEGGIIYLMSYGVKSNLFPCLVFYGSWSNDRLLSLIANSY